AESKASLERSTYEQRRQHLEQHIIKFIGGLKLSDLTTPRVYELDVQLREAGRSLAMRKKVLTNLKTMISFAQGRGLVAQNVARSVRIKDKRETGTGPLRAGVDFPSMAELRLLMENATGHWRPFIITAIFTGMRLSELRGLPWRDVDLDAGVIHVRQRADAWKTIGATKSKAGARDIPLAPIVLNALRQWKLESAGGEYVFANSAGSIRRSNRIHESCWTPLQIKCGLVGDNAQPKYSFHKLRHAAASMFIQYLGWTPKRLQTVMGHASVRLTFDLYGHLFENVEADRADMAKIEAAVRAAG
ncbi:MAG TPA: tyrosine-type recombinase/integrase, partial [Pseudolabrys sp.]|nr:tyrosine-type recombinase/integrase [Pseudolabrys sp.]